MRTGVLFLASAATCAAGAARADLPVIDAAQLTQHARTASDTVKLVPVTLNRKSANDGVKCAVTTGQQGRVADPTAAPKPEAGAAALRTYAPDMPARPDAGARGGQLGSQTLAASAGDVVGGLEASRATLQTSVATFQAAARMVGAGPTVMAALDANSGARLQNNLAWNGAVGSANLWLTALNALNLARTSDASRVAGAMRATSSPNLVVTAPLCPAGTYGAGTAADPCRPLSGTCAPAAAACTPRRVRDADGSVLLVLLPGPVAPGSPSEPPDLTSDELAAALAGLVPTAFAR